MKTLPPRRGGFSRRLFLPTLALFLLGCHHSMDRISLSPDQKTLVFSHTQKPFTPYGFNYDRDYRMRLLEDYWLTEWPTVQSDFQEMKSLGANIVRIHLSLSQFLTSPTQPNQKNVQQLKRLLTLCQNLNLYLDITGLGCYRKEAVPAWYTHAPESQRWAIQAKFWEVIAAACHDHPAVAWFDLCNECAVPDQPQKDYLTGHLADFWYCQFITLDPHGRDRGDLARAWVRELRASINPHSPRTLVTIGMLPFTSTPPSPSIGIDPPALIHDLDLICVHLYPHDPPFKDDLALLDKFNHGKPVVIEEIFPLTCQPKDLPAFFTASQHHGAQGWIGFYWGQPPAELAPSTQFLDRITHDWLTTFQSYHPTPPLSLPASPSP